MASHLPRLLARGIVILVAGASVFGGCSRQAEGERCDYDWAGPTQDCADGLVCTPCGNLQEQVVDRCCPADHSYSDPRCAPLAGNSNNQNKSCSAHAIAAQSTGGTSSASAGGSSGTGGSGGTAGTGSSQSGAPGEAGMSGAPASGG